MSSCCLTKMLLTWQEKQFTLLVRPSQCSPLDGFESVRCEKEYAVLASALARACLCGVLAVGLAELSAPQEYEEDVREFKLKVDDTDRRLGAVFCQAFEDASGLEHAFKV